MSRKYIAIVAPLLALIVTIYGCGATKQPMGVATTTHGASATSPEGSSLSPTLSHSQLVARADAICARVNAKRSTIHIGSPHSLRAVTPLAHYERTASEELARLIAPSDIAYDWRQIVVDYRTIAAITAKIGLFAQEDRLSAIHAAIITATRAQQDLLVAAQRGGFKDCADV